MSDEPLQHIERERLPWRRERLTECGHFTKDVASSLEPDAAESMIRRVGKKRAAMVLCMTCVERWSMYSRRREWEDGRDRLTQCVDRESHGKGRDLLHSELIALAELFNRHSAEFYAILDGLADTESLDEARQQWQQRKRRDSRPRPL